MRSPSGAYLRYAPYMLESHLSGTFCYVGRTAPSLSQGSYRDPRESVSHLDNPDVRLP